MTTQNLPLRIRPLVESTFGLDGGAMFGIIPKPLWSRAAPADEMNRIDLACRCLLVEYADRNVLIDTGLGSRWTKKEKEIYKISNQDPGLKNALANYDLKPSDISDVVITHLHFDHAGGLSFLENGETKASFPKARHYLQNRNWSWAHGPSARDAGSYRKGDFAFFENANAPELILLNGPEEILPGFSVHPQFGHTPGMQLCKIKTEDEIYFYLADLIATSAHLRDPYVMGYDIDPLTTLREKRDILHEAVKEDAILIFEHDPIRPLARVEKTKAGKIELIDVI